MSTPTVGPGEAARRRTKNAAGARTEICSVRVGAGLFGVPITHILEIVGGTRPVPVPLAPPFVGGLAHYRGDVLTTVSLRQLLDLPTREGPQDMLVVESASGCFGLLVDSVGVVLTVSSAEFEANPDTMNERRRMLFAGAYKLTGELVIMLDPEQLDPMRLARAA
jgi:purine-binding chemotaxis protein CheW